MIAKNLGLGLAALFSIALLAGMTSPAQAYGPEGLFGGRPRPDDVIVLDNPTLPEDRPQRAQSVLQHPRPDFDPVPITLGGFELFPSAEMGAYYDSNIYAQSDNTKSDEIIGLRPAVSAFSNWNRHSIAATAFGDLNFYTHKTDENYADFVSSVEGRYDIMAQTWIASRFGYQHLAEPRSSPDAVNGINPTTFNVANGGLTAYRGLGKLKITGNYDLRRYFYNDTPSTTGMIDQSQRDRTEQKVGPRISYDLTENLKPYVQANYNVRTYDNNHTHQSDGYDAVAGATADFGGITSADVYVGWMSQDYENFLYDNTNSGIKFGGRLEWNVTGMTTVVLETSRTIEETTGTDFNSYKATGGSATVTHELLRNVLLEADLGFTRYDFNGLGERQDDNILAGGGARWLINRYLYSDFIYNWSNRSSDASGSDYSRHLVTLRLGVQM
jgi:hypothetical protein